MKTRIFLVVAALMVFSALSFGQPFACAINGCDYQLSATCGGADYYPDGTTIYIMQDVAPLGPGPEDVIPTVGPNVGDVNFSDFQTNGSLYCGFDGTFFTDPAFGSVGGMPANPNYYLVIFCGAPHASDRHWVTETHTMAPGPQTWTPTWTCSPCGPPQCTPVGGTITTNCGSNDPSCATALCIHVCAGQTTTVDIVNANPLPLDPAHAPVIVTHAGCSQPYCNDPNCSAGQGEVGAPVPIAPATWHFVINGLADGCFCFYFDHYLAAGIESFSGAPGDNSVTLTWVTASESNINHYAIVRNGAVIGNVASENSPSTHSYTYVDNAAHNGTTYTYSLRVVNADNSVTETGMTWSGTPSFSSAVVTEYALLQNFPNPFNPTTDIAFDVLNTNPVTLKIYNAAGQVVSTLVNGATYEGGKRYITSFSADNLPSGIYFYTVKIGNEFSATKKMLLLK